MTTTINASTSSGLVTTSDNSGNILLQYNGVAAPAFAAYQSATQSLTANTWTKIQLQSEEFDTANCFDSTTNYRFTPTVAGYYQLSGAITMASSLTYLQLAIYKNGGGQRLLYQTGNGAGATGSGSSLIYLNGTTDYVELWGSSGVTQNLAGGGYYTWFTGCLLRGA
jgi:hypothetical protein